MVRISFKEITIRRLYDGVKRRVILLPLRIRWQYSRKGLADRKRLEKFKDIHKDKRCVLIANGPSLRNVDMSVFRDEITFGLNRVYLAFDDWGWETNYLVAVNDLVLEQYKDELLGLSCIKFLNWKYLGREDNRSGAYGILRGIFTKDFSSDITRGVNFGATVTYAALQIIKYMGFKEVYIVGLDHNFPTALNKIPNVTEVIEESRDHNHFLTNYFPRGHKWQTPDLISSNYFYALARNIFEEDDVSIFDCTEGGNCEIFKKLPLKSIFK